MDVQPWACSDTASGLHPLDIDDRRPDPRLPAAARRPVRRRDDGEGAAELHDAALQLLQRLRVDPDEPWLIDLAADDSERGRRVSDSRFLGDGIRADHRYGEAGEQERHSLHDVSTP